MNKLGILFGLFTLLLLPAQGLCKVLTSDTIWTGEVSLDEDILVPEGVTLTVAAGTTIRIIPSESTKTDPEFMSSLTEITVRGSLIVNGTEKSPVTFLLNGEKQSMWAGIIIDGGRADVHFANISGAESGIFVIKGSLYLTDSLLTKNRYGLTLQGEDAVVRMHTTQLRENDYGLFLFNGAKLDTEGSVVQGSRKKDRYSSSAKEYKGQEREYVSKAGSKEKNRVYGDEALLGAVVWQGRIEINGIVRVPENSRLTILPGTLVEFRKKDTNHDGIGENGILNQGTLIAKGSKESPIIFRSAEKQRRMGDWDSINIMNSDKAQNLIEYCQVEDAYRGLHFHFSNVAVTESVLRNNYRGIQFQESLVEIRGTFFYENKSAFQARDSEIIFSGNSIYHNYSGMNVFRNAIAVRGSSIKNNYMEGLRVREGLPVIEKNFIDGNRHGLMVSDTFFGSFNQNVISHNLEAGISMKGTEGVEISGNAVQGNGLYGMNIQESGALVRANFIADNLERGIGVLTFRGVITDNNISGNGLYNLGIDGSSGVSAQKNWWGGGDVRKTIFDQEDDPSKGRADYLPMLEKPVVFAWPLQTISADARWSGDILVRETISVPSGITLEVASGTKVLFAGGTGLSVKGKIVARGGQNEVISFAAQEGASSAEWDEILLDHATGSIFSNCEFENATWALHSHFTDLRVERCAFMKNSGGLRFTSGPIEVRHSLFTGNDIGIRAFRGTARIEENVITGNATGIFVREKGSGLTITRNNLSDNSSYNIRLGDFNDEDVAAGDNWWGTESPEHTIYDSGKEAGIGKVIFEPFAKNPFSLRSVKAGPAEKKGRNSDRMNSSGGE